MRRSPPENSADVAGARGVIIHDVTAQTHDHGRLGRYVVLERLGVGGMGAVYLAYDPGLDRRVAIKCDAPTGPPYFGQAACPAGRPQTIVACARSCAT